MFAKQALQFIHKFPHVFEVEVDGSKPYIGYFVQSLQTGHEQLANLAGGTFALGRIVNESLDLVHEGFEPRGRHGTLFARLQQSLQYLLAVKAFPPAILFDDHIGNLIDPFVGRETASALEAFPAAADQIASAALARIDDLVVAKRTKGTLQPALPPL